MSSPDAFPAELPTRPDHPATVARRCRHCGRVYGEHVMTRPSQKPLRYQAASACEGLRRNWEPEEHTEADAAR